jgi:uncharacterized protein YkwD
MNPFILSKSNAKIIKAFLFCIVLISFISTSLMQLIVTSNATDSHQDLSDINESHFDHNSTPDSLGSVSNSQEETYVVPQTNNSNDTASNPSSISTKNDADSSNPSSIPTKNDADSSNPSSIPTKNDADSSNPSSIPTKNDGSASNPSSIPTKNDTPSNPSSIPTKNDKSSSNPTPISTENDASSSNPSSIPTKNDESSSNPSSNFINSIGEIDASSPIESPEILTNENTDSTNKHLQADSINTSVAESPTTNPRALTQDFTQENDSSTLGQESSTEEVSVSESSLNPLQEFSKNTKSPVKSHEKKNNGIIAAILGILALASLLNDSKNNKNGYSSEKKLDLNQNEDRINHDPNNVSSNFELTNKQSIEPYQEPHQSPINPVGPHQSPINPVEPHQSSYIDPYQNAHAPMLPISFQPKSAQMSPHKYTPSSILPASFHTNAPKIKASNHFRNIQNILEPTSININKYTPENHTKWEVELIEIINEYRKQHGLGPLLLSDALTSSAQEKAEELKMFDHPDGSGFTHDSPIHGPYPNQMIHAGITNHSGENIARSHLGATPKEVFEQFRVSAGHNAIMLNSNSKYMGIGHYQGFTAMQLSR